MEFTVLLDGCQTAMQIPGWLSGVCMCGREQNKWIWLHFEFFFLQGWTPTLYVCIKADSFVRKKSIIVLKIITFVFPYQVIIVLIFLATILQKKRFKQNQ